MIGMIIAGVVGMLIGGVIVYVYRVWVEGTAKPAVLDAYENVKDKF